MKIINFEGSNLTLAEAQEQYLTMRAYLNKQDDPGTSVAFCVKLNAAEIEQVNERGEIWMKVFTFGRPFQPILTSSLMQDCVPNEIAAKLLEYKTSADSIKRGEDKDSGDNQ